MRHSEIRQVPDNQEVYLDKDGFTSIVVEILERVDRSDEEALKFHLQDIVEEDASETKIWSTAQVHFTKLPCVLCLFPVKLTMTLYKISTDSCHSQGTPAYILFATSPPGAKQRGRANEPDFVGILMTMIRLEERNTDIIVSINVPHVDGQYDKADVDPATGKQGKLLESATGYRQKLLETFEIKDWELFVQE